MELTKDTTIDEIMKEAALEMVEYPMEAIEELDFICNYPFLDNPIYMEFETGNLVDLSDSAEMSRYKDKLRKEILENTGDHAFCKIVKKYLIDYSYHIYLYLGDLIEIKPVEEFKKDVKKFQEILIDSYIRSENPGINMNLILNMFTFCNQILGSEYSDNNTVINIYRGINKPEDEVDMVTLGISWTTDHLQANWFATRFRENGTVLKTSIALKDVVADLRSYSSENEIVVNPESLRNDIKIYPVTAIHDAITK